MERPILHAPVLVNYATRKLPAHVIRHTSDGGYVAVLDETGVQLFSSSFELVGIQIDNVHPDVGAAARIRPPSCNDWISCVVNKLTEPAPAVLLEACNTGILPAPLFDSKTFSEFKIMFEYVDDGEPKHSIADPFANTAPPIGTELEIRILGTWYSGKIVEHQTKPHYAIEVAGVGRLFSQSFQLLQCETRVKRLQLGTRAIVHSKSCNISCVVVEHLENSTGSILAACSDEELRFDSRALLVLGIAVTVTANMPEEKKSVSPKSHNKEIPIEKEVYSPPSPPLSSKKRRIEIQPPEDTVDSAHIDSNPMNVQVFSQNDGISATPRKRTKKRIIEEEEEEEISPNNVKASKPNESEEDFGLQSTCEDVLNVDDSPMRRIRKNADVPSKTKPDHSTMGASPELDDAMGVKNNRAPHIEVGELPKAKVIALLDCEEEEEASEEDAKLKRIRERVLKAFRRGLHHGTPEAEMKRAMDLGRSLVKRYNLDEGELIAESQYTEQVEESGNFGVCVVKNNEARDEYYPNQGWMVILANAVSENYSVKHVIYPGSKRMGPIRFKFFGLRSSAELAAHSFCAAFDQVHRLSLKYKFNPKKHRRQKAKDVRLSYALGITRSLEEIAKFAAERERKSMTSQSRALIVRTQNAIESEMAGLGMSKEDFDNPLILDVVMVDKAHKDGCKDSSKVRL